MGQAVKWGWIPESSIPTERSAEPDQVTTDLARTTTARAAAGERLAAARGRVEQANGPLWPRSTEVRAATAGVERALHTLRQQIDKEADLRLRLEDVTAHGERRRAALAPAAPNSKGVREVDHGIDISR